MFDPRTLFGAAEEARVLAGPGRRRGLDDFRRSGDDGLRHDDASLFQGFTNPGPGGDSQFRFQDPAALVGLGPCFVRTPEGAQQSDHVDVGPFIQGVQGHAGPGVDEGGLRLLGKSRGQGFQDRAVGAAGGLGPGDEPLVEAVAVGNLHALEQLAVKQVRAGLEIDRVHLVEGFLQLVVDPAQIHPIIQSDDLDGMAVRLQVFGLGIEHRTQLGQAPAEGGAGVVGVGPEQVTEVFPGDGAALEQQVTQQGTGFPGSRHLNSMAA
jgi:hypothetical protein